MLKTYVSSIIFVYKALATAQSDPPLTMRELYAPEGHRSIQQPIEETMNEHIVYQTKPLGLRNQRIYFSRWE